jgi:hypothetical protein
MLFDWEAGAEGVGTSYYLLLTLVRSLDAISFVLLSFLCIRDYRVRRTRWGGDAYCALVVAFAVLYLDVLAEEAVWITARRSLWPLDFADGLTSVLISPLLFHAFYNGEREYLAARRVWQAWLGLSYVNVLGAVIGAVSLGIVLSPPPAHTQHTLRLWDLAFIVFSAAGTFGTLCASRRTETPTAQPSSLF